MGPFEFRLRFHLLEGDHIKDEAEELLILKDAKGSQLRLKSGESGVSIKDRSRAALLGGPYDSEEEARAAAEQAKRALLIWAVKQRVGIDLGDGKRRGGLTTHGRHLLEAEVGSPIRDDIHGVDVYPLQVGLKFFYQNFSASIGKNSKTFVETVATDFGRSADLTEKQVVAAELYCSAFFDVSFRSRLITLVSSVEALLDPPLRSPAALVLVDLLDEQVKAADVDDSTRSSVRGSLQWLRRDSIGQTARQLAAKLLPGREYAGRTAAKFFSFCYDLRSQIVHDGRTHDPAVDLLEVTNTLNGFVADLLLASLGAYDQNSDIPAKRV
jgi:hypothetical protein